ncbi:MAG: ATP-binding protein [Candidatus Marinarcus sp.]|uniref:ATP-binding protein n=1 Tax=Candidatus Marinarcus sp. TaxID=3100987 RepID=UPI003AFFBF6C
MKTNFKIGIKTLFLSLTLSTVILIVVLSFVLSQRGINNMLFSESQKYFKQSIRLAQTIFDYEVEKITSVVNSTSLSKEEIDAINTQNIDFLEEKLNKSILKSIDFSAILPTKYDKVALGGFFLYDIHPLIKELKRIKTAGIKKSLIKIDSNGKPLLFLVITKGIIDKRTGEIIGIFAGGVELQNNIKILQDIKKNTKLETISFFYEDAEILKEHALNEKKISLESIQQYNTLIHSKKALNVIGYRASLDFDSQYSLLNIKMILKNDSLNSIKDILIKDIIFVSFITIVIVILFVLLINKLLINPIESLKIYAKDFCNNTHKNSETLDLRISEYQELSNYLRSLFMQLLDNQQKLLEAKNKINSDMQMIQHLNDSLESKVQEKTKELHILNENLKLKIKIEVENNRKKDKHLIQQARYAALGEMIGNIAHQWRQPLCAMSASMSAIKLQKDLNILTDSTFDYYYEMIINNADFLSETINTFRTFFKNDLTKEKFNIHNSLKSTLQIINAAYKESDIKIIMEFSALDLIAKGSSSELSQVFINILNNAKDIMVEKEIPDKKIAIVTKIVESENLIYIYDNGGGVLPSIIEKVFDPYFTTKHKSQGTGIGLYISKEIIEKKFDGFLTVDNQIITIQNEVFDGACFTISVPVYKEGN